MPISKQDIIAGLTQSSRTPVHWNLPKSSNKYDKYKNTIIVKIGNIITKLFMMSVILVLLYIIISFCFAFIYYCVV